MTFSETILHWFRANGRELPWRATRDPYAIWLSEIILQQTRISQGLPYWERFMRRWPTVYDLAAATEDEVLREWQGLGYYSRARHLHAAAQQIAADGGFPTTMKGLLALEGVGDYTAAAIGSIAFDLPVAVVDGNVYRVLARHFGIETPINTTAGKKEFAALAASLLLPGEAAAYNQGMMDFGAMQCTPTNPDCVACPLVETCVALSTDSVDRLPVKEKRLTVRDRHIIYIYIRYEGQTVLHRRAPGDIWQGLYEPWLAVEVPADAMLLRQGVRHVLTHQVIHADFWLWEPAERPKLPADYFWVREDEVGDYGIPRLVELLMEALHAKNRQGI